MSVALTTLRPDSSMIRLPSSAFVPSSRTTSGTSRPTCLTAATTPFAIVSPFMMPPKMLTKIPLTLGSRVMILKAAVTFSSVAPPPTSRKFAGSPPTSLIVSIVAMARPAPLTRQPTLPSSLMNDRPYLLASTSAGSSSLRSRSAATSGWRKRALASKLIFASRATTSPWAVTTRGFTSRRSVSSSAAARATALRRATPFLCVSPASPRANARDLAW